MTTGRSGPDRTGSTPSARWLAWLAPVLAVVALAAVSIPRLGRPLWGDEALTVGAVGQFVDTVRASGGTMILYYVAIAPVAWLTHEPALLRLPSVLMVAGAVVVTWRIGLRLAGRGAAAGAAVTVALSWLVTYAATEVRGYGLAILLVSLSWLGLVAAVQTGRDGAYRRWWALFVVAALLAPLAHGLSALQVAAQVGALLLAPRRWFWVRRVPMLLVPLAGLLAALFSLGVGEVAAWVDPLDVGQVLALGGGLIGANPAAAVIAVAVIAGGITCLRRFAAGADPLARFNAAVPVLWAAGLPVLLVAISFFRSYGVVRYVASSVPGIALLVGVGLASIRGHRWRLAAGAVVVVALLANQPYVTAFNDEPWDEVTAVVAASAEPGEGIVATGSSRPPFDVAWDAAGRPVDLVAILPGGRVGEVHRVYPSTAWPGMHEALAGADVPGVWVIERGSGARAEVDALLAQPDVAARWEVVETRAWTDRIYVAHLVPRTEPG